MLAQWVGFEDGFDLGISRSGEPVDWGDGRVAQPRRYGQQRRPLRGTKAPRRSLEQQRALGEHQLHVLAARHLDGGIMAPRKGAM